MLVHAWSCQGLLCFDCVMYCAKHLASATLGFTHCTSHGELGNGGSHGLYTTEAKV